MDAHFRQGPPLPPPVPIIRQEAARRYDVAMPEPMDPQVIREWDYQSTKRLELLTGKALMTLDEAGAAYARQPKRKPWSAERHYLTWMTLSLIVASAACTLVTGGG